MGSPFSWCLCYLTVTEDSSDTSPFPLALQEYLPAFRSVKAADVVVEFFVKAFPPARVQVTDQSFKPPGRVTLIFPFAGEETLGASGVMVTDVPVDDGEVNDPTRMRDEQDHAPGGSTTVPWDTAK